MTRPYFHGNCRRFPIISSRGKEICGFSVDKRGSLPCGIIKGNVVTLQRKRVNLRVHNIGNTCAGSALWYNKDNVISIQKLVKDHIPRYIGTGSGNMDVAAVALRAAHDAPQQRATGGSLPPWHNKDNVISVQKLVQDHYRRYIGNTRTGSVLDFISRKYYYKYRRQ